MHAHALLSLTALVAATGCTGLAGLDALSFDGATVGTGGGGGGGGLPDGPPPGNPEGQCAIPEGAQLKDTSKPTTVIGDGTPASCTSDAFVEAVAKGGGITFDCGQETKVITLDRTAKIFNDTAPEIVIDGGGKIALNGGGKHRILYQNSCDPEQVWTTSNCDNQDHPRLTVQNLTFMDGNATGDSEWPGGGAIYALGGRFKAINSRFFNNFAEEDGPPGGGALVVGKQHDELPVYIVNSTFGGAEGLGNHASRGGAIFALRASMSLINSLITHSHSSGKGDIPAKAGTPGGSGGGAIYDVGNTITMHLCGSQISDNHANEGGGAVFFVSNDSTGKLIIEQSKLLNNVSDGYETKGYPGIFYIGQDEPQLIDSTIE